MYITLSLYIYSKLDRIFGTVVGSYAAKFVMKSDVATSPETFYYREISDHAPLILSISVRAKGDRQPRKTLPKHWTSGPVFQGRLNLLIASIRPLELPISQQLETIKSCIHEAALFTRDTLLFSDSGGREQKRLVLESMARAIWNNDVKLTRILLKVSSLAILHLQIIDGKVSCLDPPSFEELYREEKEYYHSQNIARATESLQGASILDTAKLKGKIRAARRQMTVFWPRRPFITLQGLRIRRPGQAVEQLVTDNAAVQSALVNAWRPVYTARATNADSTAKLLGYYQRNQRHLFNFSHLGVPDEEQFLETIIRGGGLKVSRPLFYFFS